MTFPGEHSGVAAMDIATWRRHAKEAEVTEPLGADPQGLETDVLVLGGGGTGLAAALGAAEQGRG